MSLRHARLAAGLSMKQLAEAVGASKSSVHKWEIGDTHPTHATAERVAELLGQPVHELFAATTAKPGRRRRTRSLPAPVCLADGCGEPCIRGGDRRWRDHCARHADMRDSWPLPIPPLPEAPARGWRDRAACLGMEVEWFYEMSDRPRVEVIEACSGCPVRGDCLMEELALPRDSSFGVRGGMSEVARSRLRARLRERSA